MYEGRKGVCLFSLSFWDFSSSNVSCHALGIIGKPLMSDSTLTWFHNVSTYGGEVIEYWIIFLLNIEMLFKLKQKIIGEFGHPCGKVGMPSVSKILMNMIWKLKMDLDLRCERLNFE